MVINYTDMIYTEELLDIKENRTLILNSNDEPDEPDDDEEEDYDADEDLEWSQTSWERNSYESDEAYEERIQDLNDYLEGFL